MLSFKIDSKCVVSQSSRARVLRPRRPKVFGSGRPRPLDREAKLRLVRYLRERRAARELTRACLDVAEKLLFKFHNAASGRCFPSYKALAAAAGCAVSTAQKAVAALERLGVLSWVHRLKREVVDGVLCVRRSSNGYAFSVPAGAPAPAPAPAPARVPAIAPASASAVDVLSPLEAALARLAAARSGAPI